MPQVGDNIPCYLQLNSLSAAKFPRAVIRDAAESLVATVDMAAVDANGLYSSIVTAMPNTDFVTVQYLIYSDSGHTALDQEDGPSLDIFFKESSGGGGSGNAVSSEVTGILYDGSLTGVVEDCQ